MVRPLNSTYKRCAGAVDRTRWNGVTSLSPGSFPAPGVPWKTYSRPIAGGDKPILGDLKIRDWGAASAHVPHASR